MDTGEGRSCQLESGPYCCLDGDWESVVDGDDAGIACSSVGDGNDEVVSDWRMLGRAVSSCWNWASISGVGPSESAGAGGGRWFYKR